MDRFVQTQTQINSQKGREINVLYSRAIEKRKRHTAQACMAFAETYDQIVGDAYRNDRNENGRDETWRGP